MKRISLALAAIGLTAGAFAALPAATDPTVVNVPQLPGGFVVGATGFYLQPTNSNGDLDFATVNNVNNSGTSFSSKLHNVDPGYDWGWGINVGYIFPNTGNDVNLSYFQLDTSDTAKLHDANLNPDTIFPVILPINGVNSFSAKAEYDLDQVDLTAGQYIDVGCRLTLHPFAGLRWAQLERKLTENATVTNTSFSSQPGEFGVTQTTHTNAVAASLTEKSDFEGIGPIVGLDASYYVGMGFGVVGHFDSALLIGSTDSSVSLGANISNTTAFTSFAPGATIITHHSAFGGNFSASSTTRVVPVLDAKLGVDYTYVFNNSANSDLTLEAGWMVSNYFNAVDQNGAVALQGAIFNEDASSPIAAASAGPRSTSDVGLQGPYVSLTAHL